MKRRMAGVVLWSALVAGVLSGCKKAPGPAGPDPVPTPTPTPPSSLSGAWIGLVAENRGATVVAPYDGSNPAAGNCTSQSDMEVTFTHTGNALSGPCTAINRVNCPERGRAPYSDIVRFTVSATLSPPNTIVVENVDERGQIPLTGTYTATTIDVTARGPHPNGGMRTYTLRLRRK
jgi:hypothetical protein